ncbi:helix-turn-helix domain-containing protein [Streptomyces sp. BG9H]|uniref:Helix-turn-helix domain-containing protein n=1 Tax=Streptomyces anatolicus TaxID=2675858 RepID=A0ABS6YMT5_9ACTN|nr:helix-turn-helix transcriptional regulator [Streptomyces anatolicus]MBW5422733.1 helix-turn-helix domain-containing protein [Streptomyces anatolicus]
MPATSRPQSAPALSHRERQVLAHIAEGLSHKQVARRLGISVHTVSTYLRRIRTKRTAPTVAHLVHLSRTENAAPPTGQRPAP